VGDFSRKRTSRSGWRLGLHPRPDASSADAVEDNGWQDYVVGENTKEAREIKAEITGRDISDFETKTAPAAAPRRTPPSRRAEPWPSQPSPQVASSPAPGGSITHPLGTAIPSITAAASKITATWTSWVEVGATDEGITYTESTDTSDITVAESLYPIRTVVTGEVVAYRVHHERDHDLNWVLAMNGGTATSTGATTTKLTTYVPPLVGAEVRVMLAFVDNLDTEAIVWPQVFNVGSVEYVRGTYDTKAGLSVEFNAEIPANRLRDPVQAVHRRRAVAGPVVVPRSTGPASWRRPGPSSPPDAAAGDHDGFTGFVRRGRPGVQPGR
jgi:hypothetical protein